MTTKLCAHVHSRRWLAVIVASCAAVFALSSISGSQARAGTSAKATIVIGDECNCSGVAAATDGGWYQGIHVWADWMNAHGGILGHKVSIDEIDTESNPTGALTATRQFADNHHVVAVFLGGGDTGVAPVVSSAKLPVVGGLVADTNWGTNPYYFPVGPTLLGNYQVLAAASAKNAHNASAAIFYCAEASNCAQAVPTLTAATEAAGGKVVYEASVAATAPDYTAQCLAAQSAGAGYIYLIDAAQTNEAMANSCAESHYNPRYVLPSFVASEATVASLAGASVPLGDRLFSTDAKFMAAVEKYDSSLPKAAYWGEVPYQAWVSGQALAKAIELAKPTGAITRATVIGGLHRFRNQTLGGDAPPLTFRRGKPIDVPCGYVATIVHSGLTSPTSPTCVK